MPRIVFETAATLNGFIADEENSLDWLFAVVSDEQPPVAPNATVQVEGSTTYEWVLEHENLMANPQKWAEYFGEKPTFVFTRRDLPVPEGADVRFVRGAVADALPTIREAAGDGDIWIVGGGDLAAQFLDAGALDEISVSFAPATVTGGAPLFPRGLNADRLRLKSAKAVGQFAHLVFDVLPPN
ncbi:dihydrofolate reductase family protein [Salinibacterium sp. M195]|uniref:dihydrofolate reductase family protein n=1 Tax=Salinibacterium sp. M195 TaxID=2583374 RepID=UPI001C63A7CA|nr:dihydrofolate reductase family protein [Salinibacterium sp. M195]QYH36415.1 dihydrofolate reductase [Salinibacterium sp. M195]